MSRATLIFEVPGGYAVPVTSLIRRINYQLKQLTPYRELYYRPQDKNYYIRTISSDPAEHMQQMGPYCYKYLIALADHLNVWSVTERTMNPKYVIEKGGAPLDQVRLPPELRFDVVTHVLADAIKTLRGKGYTVTAPVRDPIEQQAVDLARVRATYDETAYTAKGQPAPGALPHSSPGDYARLAARSQGDTVAPAMWSVPTDAEIDAMLATDDNSQSPEGDKVAPKPGEGHHFLDCHRNKEGDLIGFYHPET